MDKIIVLMSTYNGQQYVQDQIDSILAQQGVEVKLIIRDDGSNDNTLAIVEEYEKRNQLTLIKGNNIGPAKSFIELLFLAPHGNYYSFSDQDDVWDKDKLLVGIEKIKNIQGPALYHGLAGRVDEHLNSIANPKYDPLQTFAGSLLTSATGCTIVFNDELMQILRIYKPQCISMHDAWVYRVAYAFNSFVYYDNESHMKYRQHGNNVSGGTMTFKQKINRQLTKNKGQRRKTAEELYKGYGERISSENRKRLYDFVNYKNNILCKIKVLFGNEFRTNSIKTNAQYKLLFLLNRI